MDGGRSMMATVRRAGVIAGLAIACLAQPAAAATVSQNERLTADDGVSLATTISGEGPLSARPVIVEMSPYGRASGTLNVGPDYNYLLVQTRGPGDRRRTGRHGEPR